MTLVALVRALVTRVAPCECREFPLDGENIRTAAKARQGGDNSLALALSLSDFMLMRAEDQLNSSWLCAC